MQTIDQNHGYGESVPVAKLPYFLGWETALAKSTRIKSNSIWGCWFNTMFMAFSYREGVEDEARIDRIIYRTIYRPCDEH
jgi:hypothetical protein